ncbi:hypothetical protein LCGC14_2728180, partial [marine sediment metagenome]
LGVGTDTPQRTVHIESSFACLRLSDSNAANDQQVNTLIEFYRGNNTNRVGYWAMDSTSNDIMALATEYAAGILQFRTGSGIAAMTIDASQNAGIGLTTIDANYKLIVRRATDVNFGIGLQSSELAITAFNDAISANVPMRFYASEYNFLNGSVGINTTVPGYKLHVLNTADNVHIMVQTTLSTKSAFLRADSLDAHSGIILERADANKWVLFNNGDGSDEFQIGPTTGTPKLTILQGGDMGINIADPLAKLHIDQAASGGAIPVLALDQADVDKEFIAFIGTAAAADLSRSLVDEGDQGSETRAGWFEIHVTDSGGQIANSVYYVPFYQLSA